MILASAVVEQSESSDPEAKQPPAANVSELKPIHELPSEHHEKPLPPHKARIVRPKQVDLMLKFTGEMSEHGPHAPVLGPDGLIYVLDGRSQQAGAGR